MPPSRLTRVHNTMMNTPLTELSCPLCGHAFRYIAYPARGVPEVTAALEGLSRNPQADERTFYIRVPHREPADTDRVQLYRLSDRQVVAIGTLDEVIPELVRHECF